MPKETTQNPQHINPWIIAIAVMLSTFMEVLDTTVVNVSLPHIAGSLSVTVEEATWTLTSYLVANAIILPLTGWLSTHFNPSPQTASPVGCIAARANSCGAVGSALLYILGFMPC
jgi:DHA2 family multidrug resistance protein